MCYYLPSAWPQGNPTPALKHNRSSQPASQILHLDFNQILEKLELIFQPQVYSKDQTEMLFSLWESSSHTKEQKGYYIIQEIVR